MCRKKPLPAMRGCARATVRLIQGYRAASCVHRGKRDAHDKNSHSFLDAIDREHAAGCFRVGRFTHPRAEPDKYQMRNIFAATCRTSNGNLRHPTALVAGTNR